VLGAAISGRVGDPNPLTQNYAMAIVAMLNASFGGPCPTASWVVSADGTPTNYGTPINELYDPNWDVNTPLHDSVQGFLKWLDETEAGWSDDLKSTHP
jgi:hypothetical protein